ncbi:MAG: low temperature requirement protein A [Phycisphaeraceae bacterium]|nr:low temperature requirement protein A [Phycisphaeraceae bacterium]
MTSRDPHEQHRAATPLELLYDLCFVVAIAQAAAGLHHAIAHGQGFGPVLSFGLVFFAIWWAWMGFAWFASAFDTDDVVYRLKVLVQMVGVLVLAAGVPRAFEHTDYRLITAGYVIMRLGLVAQWLRAAKASPEYRTTALRYAIGIVMCQVGWVLLLLLPHDQWMYGWLVCAPLELCVPAWAERAKPTSWHPHHIVERYGLLTIIVIGESVLAATMAIEQALDAHGISASLWVVIVSAPVIIFSMWWLYFARPQHTILTTSRRAFLWGYSHYFVFASAVAVGAGIGVSVDDATHHTEHLSGLWAGYAVSIPVAVYLLSLWFAQSRCMPLKHVVSVAYFGAIALVLLAPFTSISVAIVAGTLAALTMAVVVVYHNAVE